MKLLLRTPLAYATAFACAISYTAIASETTSSEQKIEKKSAIEKRLEVIEIRSSKKSYAESAQEVPTAITALSGEQIEAMGAETIIDVAYAAPNVNLAPIGTVTGVANYSIRGMGVVNSIPSVDPAVGVVNDGVSLGTIYGALTSTFDVESVEILRGPQGTLFGRNVTGGVVNLRSARPSENFEGKVRATIGSEKQQDFAISVGGGLTENLLAKVAILTTDKDGGIDNISVGRKQGAADSTLIRPMVTYLSDGFDFTVIAEIFESNSEDVPVWSPLAFTDESISHKTANQNILDNEQEWTSLIVENNIDVFDGRLTTIYGHKELDVDSWAELGAGVLEFRFGNKLEQEQDSLEVRWSGEISDTMTLTTGIYLFDQTYDYDEERYIGGDTHYIRGGEMEHSSQAVFASLDYVMNDQLTLTFGGRYGSEDKTAKVYIVGSGACTQPIDYLTPGDHSSCSAPEQKNDWANFSPKFGVKYRLSDDDMVYGSWSNGFRSGGYNFRHPDPQSSAAYEEESLSALELGYKSTFIDGDLLLNIALFENNVTDLQSTANRPQPNGDILAIIANEAEVTLTGIEVDGFYVLTDNIGIDFSWGYTDHKYNTWPAEEEKIDAGNGSVDSLSDLALPMSPKIQTYIGLVIDQKIGDLGYMTYNLNYAYNGKTFGDQSNSAVVDSYSIVNANVIFDFSDNDLSIKTFVRNATDEAYSAFAYSLGSMLAPARSYGVEVNYNF
jgi:iron complex outermembrane receptor protein